MFIPEGAAAPNVPEHQLFLCLLVPAEKEKGECVLVIIGVSSPIDFGRMKCSCKLLVVPLCTGLTPTSYTSVLGASIFGPARHGWGSSSSLLSNPPDGPVVEVAESGRVTCHLETSPDATADGTHQAPG